MNAGCDPQFYKTAYEGFESPDNFRFTNALRDYQQLLLEKSEPEASFIIKHLGRGSLSVLELCSGNGRLLEALALKGVLRLGLGVEISQTRVQFAQQWASELGTSRLVGNIVADVLEFDDFDPGSFDLVACMTGAFAYFKPIRPSAPFEVLAKMRRAVAPGGYVLLQLYQMSDHLRQMFALNSGKLRTWRPLPPHDPFAFYLDDLEYRRDLRVLRHGKIFIRRDGRIDAEHFHVVTYYTSSELTALLRDAGFSRIQLFGGIDGSSHHEGQSASMIALASVDS